MHKGKTRKTFIHKMCKEKTTYIRFSVSACRVICALYTFTYKCMYIYEYVHTDRRTYVTYVTYVIGEYMCVHLRVCVNELVEPG